MLRIYQENGLLKNNVVRVNLQVVVGIRENINFSVMSSRTWRVSLKKG